MKTLLKLTFLFLFLSSCTDNENKTYGNLGEAVMNDKAVMIKKNQLPSEVKTVERKLIKNGNIEFETENLEKTNKTILDASKQYKAYISSNSSYKNSNRLSTTITVRIPANNFDAFLANISKDVAKFDSKNIRIKDVTEQFLDIETRLKTKKQIENRYLQILQKATTVTEILQVEKQIGILRTDIESIEGRLKYLKNQVSFSTLHITYYTLINTDTNFSRKFKSGFSNGFDNLVWFFVALVNIWPFIIILAILILAFKRWRKKRIQ